ncbi:MAG: twin-arginine translocation signal domain-containing protein [Magnetococcales bacterium]|nr:twin-arginine translocation signal domain-containing protein [Magnetococcales bacterium]
MSTQGSDPSREASNAMAPDADPEVNDPGCGKKESRGAVGTGNQSRRAFLGGIGALGLAGVATTVTPGGVSQGPVERELKEADFYAPHDLAG